MQAAKFNVQYCNRSDITPLIRYENAVVMPNNFRNHKVSVPLALLPIKEYVTFKSYLIQYARFLWF